MRSSKKKWTPPRPYWVFVSGALFFACMFSILLLEMPTVTVSVKPPACNAYGSSCNPIALGNWHTQAGINWWGAGYYCLPNGSASPTCRYEPSQYNLIIDAGGFPSLQLHQQIVNSQHPLEQGFQAQQQTIWVSP